MKQFINKNKIFLSLYLLFLLAGGVFLAVINKGGEILWFNSLHSGLLDKLFIIIHVCLDIPPKVTFITFIIALLLSYGKSILYFFNAFINGIAIIILKDHIFSTMPRPFVFFADKVQLHFVEGVHLHNGSGFPSSYTCNAFALFFMLSIFLNNKKWSYLFFGLSILAVFTRIYLFENFFSDLYFGSILGMSITTVLYLTFAESKFYCNIKWKDRSLVTDILNMLRGSQKLKQPPV